MTFRFKPEDFQIQNRDYPMKAYRGPSIGEAAEIANELLDAYVRTLPEVFTYSLNEETKTPHPPGAYASWSSGTIHHDTHRAKLWGVEELKPKTCAHLNVELLWAHGSTGHCRDCGKRLVAKWEEENE